MREAVILEAVRTPIGRRNGKLKDVHAIALGAIALTEVVKRAGVDPGQVTAPFLGGERMESTILETSVKWEPVENYFFEGSFSNNSWTGGEHNIWMATFGVNVR